MAGAPRTLTNKPDLAERFAIGARAPSAPRMRPGEVVEDRFAIEGPVAAGGMGQVFRALDRQSGEPVALKVALEGDTPQKARFGHEVKALAELSHPGIVRYVAHGVTALGLPYLAMEWLEGEDL